jgi:NAD(P)-dependent dehydrogenase (short-subunit alcohol dehydrogenase family)
MTNYDGGPTAWRWPRHRAIALLAAISLAGGLGQTVAGCAAAPASDEGAMPNMNDAAAAPRVVLITGSTDGLGRELALRLAATGAHVLVHGRNEERGRQVVEEIGRQGAGSARFYAADLASLREVRGLAEAVLRDQDRLDVLINNAGIGSAPPERLVSEDGHELRFAVNYLSHYLLTRLLLPRIVASAPARIVNVASGAQTPIDFDDVMLTRDFSGSRAYAQSKLAQVLFTVDLADELEGTGVIVAALHPATFMDTEMVRRAGVEPRTSVAEGADAVMNLVTSAEIPSGQYYSGLSPARANDQAYDEEARARLRRLSDELTGAPARAAGGGP